MDNISTFELIVYTLAMSFMGFLSASIASESMEESRNKSQKPVTWAVFVISSAIMGALFKIAYPIVYAIILILLAGLQLINFEGKKRRQSWNVLGLAYAALLALSVVYHRGSRGFRWTMLLWLIPAALPFIAGAVRAVILNKKGKAKKKPKMDSIELRGHIISWSIVAVLIVTFIVLALI